MLCDGDVLYIRHSGYSNLFFTNRTINPSFIYICALFYVRFMNILSKVRAVEKLFKVLNNDVQQLYNATGIKCAENCIQCCTTPRIEATALEFYPLAYHLYKTRQAETMLAKIEQINAPSVCPALNNLTLEGTRPGCMFYDNRGLVCRLFGYSYSTDKYGKRRLNTCKTIKTEQPEQLERANKLLETKPAGPKASDYYSRLQIIDFHAAQKLYPIGEAVRIAIETIVTNFHYRGKKAM